MATALIQTRENGYLVYFGEDVCANIGTFPTLREAESQAMLAARKAGIERFAVKRQNLAGHTPVEVGTATASGIMSYTASPPWSDDEDRAIYAKSMRNAARMRKALDNPE